MISGIVAKCPGTSRTVPEFFVLSPVPYGRCFFPEKIAIGLFSFPGLLHAVWEWKLVKDHVLQR